LLVTTVSTSVRMRRQHSEWLIKPSILKLGLRVLVFAFLSQAAAEDRPRAGQATASPSPGLQNGAQADASDSNSDSTNDEESEEKSRSKLAEGILPGRIKIPGTRASLRFSGYAKVDFIQDLDPIDNEFQFQVNSIPVEGSADSKLGGRTTLSAKEMRFNLDLLAETSSGEAHAFLEGDFFGDGTSFRLRHGFGEWRGWLGGQTWTTFMDIAIRPHTLDSEGPDSEIFLRQPMIRYTGKPSDTLEWAVAVEDPDSQVSVPAAISGEGRSEFPDIPGYVRFEPDWGSVQLAGIVRQLRYVGESGNIDETALGYGLNLSGRTKVGKRDAIMGQIGVGRGIGRYVNSFAGTDSDAALTPAGNLEALPVSAAVVAFDHYWSERLRSTVSLSYAEIDNDPSQPDSAIHKTQSPHANLVWHASDLVMFGGEVMWGRRTNKNGDRGEAWRVQFSLKVDFNRWATAVTGD